jgi:hypothetical protein
VSGHGALALDAVVREGALAVAEVAA